MNDDEQDWVVHDVVNDDDYGPLTEEVAKKIAAARPGFVVVRTRFTMSYRSTTVVRRG